MKMVVMGVRQIDIVDARKIFRQNFGGRIGPYVSAPARAGEPRVHQYANTADFDKNARMSDVGNLHNWVRTLQRIVGGHAFLRPISVIRKCVVN